jgi:hypothetical protein
MLGRSIPLCHVRLRVRSRSPSLAHTLSSSAVRARNLQVVCSPLSPLSPGEPRDSQRRRGRGSQGGIDDMIHKADTISCTSPHPQISWSSRFLSVHPFYILCESFLVPRAEKPAKPIISRSPNPNLFHTTRSGALVRFNDRGWPPCYAQNSSSKWLPRLSTYVISISCGFTRRMKLTRGYVIQPPIGLSRS